MVRWRRGEFIRPVPVKVHVQHIPSRGEVYGMADAAGLRNRAVILCLFQSGVRANCLSRWDMPLCGAILKGDFSLPYPLRITAQYDTKISSYGLAYYATFLGSEAVSALRDWLKYRVVKGWIPGEKSMVWGNNRYPRVEGSIGIHQIDMIVRGAAEKIGISQGTMWTHLLRKSFQKSLNQATIDEDTKESLMGHVLPGARGNYFDYHDVEEIRDKYTRVPLGREAPAELSGLREEVEELRRSNLELKVGLVLEDKKRAEAADARSEWLDRDHEWHKGLIEMVEKQTKEVERLRREVAELKKRRVG